MVCYPVQDYLAETSFKVVFIFLVTEKITKTEYDLPESSNSQEMMNEENVLNDGKMYMTLLDEKTKACLETQELKLVNENGEMEQFVFIPEEGAQLGLESAVVTKQNNDGTISLTTVKGNEIQICIVIVFLSLFDLPNNSFNI